MCFSNAGVRVSRSVARYSPSGHRCYAYKFAVRMPKRIQTHTNTQQIVREIPNRFIEQQQRAISNNNENSVSLEK